MSFGTKKPQKQLNNSLRVWRNWYTRTFEGRVALPCEFESRHPHCLKKRKAIIGSLTGGGFLLFLGNSPIRREMLRSPTKIKFYDNFESSP